MTAKNKGPFQIKISLRLLKDKFEELLNSDNVTVREQAEYALDLLDQNPVLVSGTFSEKEFNQYTPVINQLMPVLFPPVLSVNEIKGAVLPYSNDIFYCSDRLRGIINNANSKENIFYELYKDSKDSFDLMSYAIILNSYYNYKVDFDRPKSISVTDKKGVKKRYRVNFNADFLDIYPNDNAIKITDDILDKL